MLSEVLKIDTRTVSPFSRGTKTNHTLKKLFLEGDESPSYHEKETVLTAH